MCRERSERFVVFLKPDKTPAVAFVAGISDVTCVSARQNGPDSASGPAGIPSPQELLRRLEIATAELQVLGRQLEHADRLAALGTLAATIAHEFNNLLTPSMNWAQLALRSIESGKPDLDLAKKALTKCHSSGKKAGRVCEAILNLARPGSENQSSPAECDLAEVVDEALAALARDPAQDGITLRRQVPAGLRIAIDSLQLEHVLVNLLINAQQAMHGRRRGTLTIAAALADTGGGSVRLEITDSGCGIDAADLPRIFDSFFTARKSPTAGNGTGLGLALCRKILQRHGGAITAHSTPGRGTTFRLLLPVSRAAKAPRDLAA